MTPITKKQYVISTRKLSLEGVTEYRLFGRYIYVGDGLKITACESADGQPLLLLGHAYCMDQVDKRVEDDMWAFTGDDLCELTRYWTGRWVLVTQTQLITDAAGLMSVFYHTEENGYVISSSLALMADALGLPVERSVPTTGLTWQLLPRTLVPAVKALLCTQQITFKESGLSVESAMWMQDRRSFSTEEKCKAVADMLTNAAKNIYAFSDQPLMLALTGGKDSRVTMAALLHAAVPFEAYTAEHEMISYADKRVPPALCHLFGVPYRYVSAKQFNAERFADYQHFGAKNSNGADAQFYARGQYDALGDTIVLRSGLYEAGQTYGRSIAEAASFAEGRCNYYSDLKTDSAQRAALNEWLETVRGNADGFVDIRDRFYIEQRVGGWAAAIEQSMDMNEFTSIQIANCAELLSVLLSCNEEERQSLALSYGTMRVLEPRVLEIPVNKKVLADRLAHGCHILRHPITKLQNFLHKKHRR